MYIQTIDNMVVLIGDESVGLPLPTEVLMQNPNVRNLKADKYKPLPEINDFYDEKNDVFIPYEEWIQKAQTQGDK